ncbi:MAG: hypothetical protein Q9207_005093 [Kuettlingeria erythrocarpa]
MDVHRCRFVPYPPSAINALAFSHPSSLTTSSKGPPTLRLAIGRANGDLEIWNPLRGAWHQESIIRGGKDRSIEGLAWTQDPEEEDKNGFKVPGRLRLFSIGYSSSVTEWEIATGRPLRHASANYGELWCMAAQSRLPSTEKDDTKTVNGVELGITRYQSIVVGCADGSIVILSTADGDLQFQRTLTRPPKRQARVLSIAWQSRNTVVTGHADSTIRIYDTRNGQQIRQMSLGAGPQGGPKEILVWSVKCMVDGTIVSGDSTGTVSFWDAKNYSRLQRITSHKADILEVAVSADGETVFSGGMDRRTSLYRRTAGSKPGEKKRWAEVAHQRFHSHDVKAMAVFETKKISILASGGLDTTPVIVPIREFGKEHHRALSALPQQPPVRSVPSSRLLVSWWDREVSIWRVSGSAKKQGAEAVLEGLPQPPEKKLVAKVLLQGEESITSADILQDSSMLAVSTLSETKIFRLKEKVDGTITLRKLDLPEEMTKFGAKHLHASPDCKWLLCITSNNKIQLLRIMRTAEPERVPYLLPRPINLRRLARKPTQFNYLHGSHGAYDRSICRVEFSSDSRILVVGDLSGHLDTFVLEGHEDLTQDPPVTSSRSNSRSSSSSSSSSSNSDVEAHPTLVYAQHWRRNPTAHLIPKLPSAPLIMSFRPSLTPLSSSSTTLTNGATHLHPTRHTPHPHSHDLPHGESRLFILTAEHQIYEFDILAGQISDWSRRNPTSTLPSDFRAIRDRAMGSVWDVNPTRQRIWLYGSAWLWMFNLAQDLPKPSDTDDDDDGDSHEGFKSIKDSTKRKRRKGMAQMLTHDADGDDVSGNKRRKETESGAGGKIRAHELGTGIGRSVRRTVGPDGKDAKIISLDHDLGTDASDLEEEDEAEAEAEAEESSSSALIHLRRGEPTTGIEAGKDVKRPPPYWGTYKYRPILGIVPIGSRSETDGGVEEEENDRGVEVALVERPMFEVDLPGRYHGDQEWQERKDMGDLVR